MQASTLFQLVITDVRIQADGFFIVETGLLNHRQNLSFGARKLFLEVLLEKVPFRVGTHDCFPKIIFVGMANNGC